MKIKLVSSLILALALLVLASSPVYAIPALPHAFYGDVKINGSPAPDGTQISATVDVGDIVPVQNPVGTTGGKYGNPYLLVQGSIKNGATITFYVNGVSTGQTAIFEAGGGPTQRDLSVTIAAPPGPAPPRYYIDTTLFGIEASFRISSTGEILETIEAISEDGMLTMTVIEGTIALDIDGEPLETLTTAIDPSPPCPLREDAYIIGVAYAFSPAGATFAPPLTLSWSYDPDALPKRVAEEDLIVAYCDKEIGEWVEIPSIVDLVTHTVTATVSHFTTFAIIAVPVAPPEEEEILPVGEEEEEEEEVITVTPAAFSVSSLSIQPAGVKPGEAVTISIVVANTGGTEGSYTVVLKVNGVKEAEKKATIAAGGSQSVSFVVTREEAGSYTVTVDGLSGSFTVVPVVTPPAKPGINWPLIGGIIGGVIVVGLGVFFWMRRRVAY